MAKKKEKEDIVEESKIDFSSVFIDAAFIRDNPKEVLNISPSFDDGLNGGIPKGSFVIISGRPKTGKTYSIMHIVNKHLNQFPNAKCLYLDVEHRLKSFHLSLPGLPIDRITVLRSVKGNLLSAEDFLTAAEQYIRDNADCIVVVDSSSALLPKKEQMEETISGELRAITPKLLSHFCKRIAQILPVQDAILIMITHLAQDIGAKTYVPIWKEDGGQKIQFQSDIKIRCKTSSDWMDGDIEVGKVIQWSVEWASLGRPGRIIKSWIRYGLGVDEVMELIEYALNFGLITKAGAWYKCDFMEELGDEPRKAQGEHKLRELIASDEKYIKFLMEQFKESK